MEKTRLRVVVCVLCAMLLASLSCEKIDEMVFGKKDDEEIDPETFEKGKQQFAYYFTREVSAPRVVSNGILFTYLPKKGEREILLSGDFFSWSYSVPLHKGKYGGIYFYLLPKKLKKGKYTYRFRVDGKWINDPQQTNTMFDDYNLEISYFEVPHDTEFYFVNPIYQEGGDIVFFYSNLYAEEVHFTCNYYDFDPYRFSMQQDNRGIWTIRFREDELPPGTYYYNFIVDDVWQTDPLNHDIYEDSQGRKHSHIIITNNEVLPPPKEM